VILSDIEVRGLVERMLASSGRRVDLSNPFVDATLADGSRLHVAIPDITRKHWSVNIRKFIMGSKSLDGLVSVGTLTDQAAAFLQACVIAGLNIIVAGATQAGKTTLMNALLNSAPSSDRVITCEEVFELQLTSPDWIALQTRQPSLEGTGEIPLRRLIKEALRMRPSRLVVGEVRQEEALDLLVAMNAGMPSMCSLHANGAREAISKLCLLPMLAGSNVSAEFVIPTVASVVDIVVHTSLQHDGTRRVQHITSVTGRVEGNSIETGDIFSMKDSELEAHGVFPGKVDRFAAHNIDLASLVGASRWV
jgi:pilus assembly protein CpaF